MSSREFLRTVTPVAFAPQQRMALPPKDRPAWMAPLYVEDATQRQQNWKDMKISKDQLASLGKYAWNFYFALIKYNENAQQLRSKLRRDQGFNLFRTTWDIVAEVENGGWAQYWWNLVANNAHNMELKEMVENSINCMKKLFEAQPISEEELMTMKYKTTDPAKLVEDAADACNWNLLLQKLQQTAKGKNESQKTEPFRVILN